MKPTEKQIRILSSYISKKVEAEVRKLGRTGRLYQSKASLTPTEFAEEFFRALVKEGEDRTIEEALSFEGGDWESEAVDEAIDHAIWETCKSLNNRPDLQELIDKRPYQKALRDRLKKSL